MICDFVFCDPPHLVVVDELAKFVFWTIFFDYRNLLIHAFADAADVILLQN